MNSVRNRPEAALTDTQRAALISLLSDDDTCIYETIRTKILSFGPEASDWLRPHLLSSDPLLRRRSREIVDYFARQDADTDFLAFCLKQGEDFDIEHSLWLLARTRYPSINVQAYRALLDSFVGELRTRILYESEADRVIASLNEVLFDELNFVGNEENYYDPENSYLNRVLDRRTGNPISLCLIYMLVARRVGLPIIGIGLPGHFICRYQTSREEIYIDAFNRGKRLTKADCIRYLVQTNHNLDEGHLLPVTPRKMILRICANLHQIYAQQEDADEVSRLQRYLVALAK
jgi:regulator of sirC expression with transglutaminase-like and TPR domain